MTKFRLSLVVLSMMICHAGQAAASADRVTLLEKENLHLRAILAQKEREKTLYAKELGVYAARERVEERKKSLRRHHSLASVRTPPVREEEGSPMTPKELESQRIQFQNRLRKIEDALFNPERYGLEISREISIDKVLNPLKRLSGLPLEKILGL